MAADAQTVGKILKFIERTGGGHDLGPTSAGQFGERFANALGSPGDENS
jgi:hypothetical protein